MRVFNGGRAVPLSHTYLTVTTVTELCGIDDFGEGKRVLAELDGDSAELEGLNLERRTSQENIPARGRKEYRPAAESPG